jgi:hypothetical protein
MATGAATQIDATYLNGLKGQLQTLLTDVQNQLKGIGNSPDGWVSPVDQNLKVLPGATSFNAGAALNTALQAMGGSIHDQLTWLQKTLTDMINEITTTVNSFSNTESLNTETVDQLISDFQGTINDFNNPPGSSGPPASSTPPPPGSSTPPPPGGSKQ